MLKKSIGGRRVGTEPKQTACMPRAKDRRLPAALTCCCSCGRRIQKEQFKWAIIERLTRNPELSLAGRLRIMQAIFPEDTPEESLKRIGRKKRSRK